MISGAFCAICSWFRCRRSRYPDLSGDVCVVTGAGQGLGRHIALQLSECGATLVLWDVNNEAVQAVEKEIRDSGRNAHCYVVDCSKREEVYRAAEQVREEVGDVAVLVNNAAIGFTGSFVKGETKDEQIEKTFSVNILALFWTTKAFLPWMMDNNYGYVVNVGSMASHVATPYTIAYGATKAALRSFSNSLRYELQFSGKSGVSVMCAYPSFINTDRVSAAAQELIRERNFPLSEPEDVARAILHGMERRKRDLFLFSSDKNTPLLSLIIPTKALDFATLKIAEVTEIEEKRD